MSLPKPNLDDQDFFRLVEEARALIPSRAPEWTDHNIHDPGITFLDLFAWLAEIQRYRLNRVSEPAYQRFFRLAGLVRGSRRPAQVAVTFQYQGGTPLLVPTGTRVTPTAINDLPFETIEDVVLTPAHLLEVITRASGHETHQTSAEANPAGRYEPFGSAPTLGNSLSLGFDRPFTLTGMRLSISLYEDHLPPRVPLPDSPSGFVPSARIAWEYQSGSGWLACTPLADTTLALVQSGDVVFGQLPDAVAVAGRWWLRATLAEGHYEIAPRIAAIRTNSIRARQVETILNEQLEPGRGTPDQTVRLKKYPVLPADEALQTGMPATRPEDEASSWVSWTRVADLADSGPDDRHYVLDAESGEIRFGNGLNGRVPLVGESIRARFYRYTRAEAGNVPAGLSWVLTPPPDSGMPDGVRGVNFTPGEGGTSAESLEQAQFRSRQVFRTPQRALTAADYESMALQVPGLRVARAKALPNHHPAWPCVPHPGEVTIVVVPTPAPGSVRPGVAPPSPSPGFRETVRNFLNARRTVTTRVHVTGPRWVEVIVRGRVFLRRGAALDEARRRVEERLNQFLDALEGGPSPGGGWPFGRAVFPSGIHECLAALPQVEFTTEIGLNGNEPEQSLVLPPQGLPFPGTHALVLVPYENRTQEGLADIRHRRKRGGGHA